MHAQFDEGMNDLPVTGMPPNVAHLARTNNGQPVEPNVSELHASNFAFDVVPFVPIFTGWLKRSDSTNDASFGLQFEDNPKQRVLERTRARHLSQAGPPKTGPRPMKTISLP